MPNKSDLIYSRPTDVASAPDFFISFISTLTGGAWGYIIVGIVFSITYLALTTFNARRAFAAASFTSFVTTVMLASFGAVGTYLFTLTGLMVALSVAVNRGGDAKR